MNFRKIVSSVVSVLVGYSSMFAALPECTPQNVEKYKKICRENIHKVKKGMYREPKGSLRHKFITPGCAVGNRPVSDYARDGQQGRLQRVYGIPEGMHIQCVGLLRSGGIYTNHNRAEFPFTRGDDQPD